METFYCPEGRKGKDIFQSTPPRGWRRISVVSSDLKVCISIHSTTRVETRLESNLLDISGISIHSTTRVETHDWIPLRYPPGDFNPLHHEGGDIACFPTSDILDDFNPLHHEGGDLLDLASMAPAQVISIHSTTRVETHEMCESGEIPYISIHSTTRVETLPLVRMDVIQAISIHSTTRVETAILHNNHYYSSTHFHKQIISHPLKSRPTIPAHSQIRSHCANFPVRISP